MSAAMTEWRKHVKTVLEPVIGVKIQPGKIDGPVERSRRACIFPDAQQENPEVVDQQLLTVILRVFLPVKTQRDAGVAPHDPEPLETLGELMQTTWREHVLEGGVWFSRMVGVEYDLDQNMLEATFLAYDATSRSSPSHSCSFA